MALIGTGTNPVTWTKSVTGWFERNRGLALGITMAGTGVVGTFAPVAANALIADVGWRGAYQALGLAIAVIGLPVLWLFFRDRHPPARAAASSATATPPAPRGEGLETRAVLRSYRFWALGVAMLLICGCVAGLITNLVPLLTDKGLPRGEAAGYAAMVGVSVIVGRIVAGYLIDIVWAPAVAFVFLAAPAVSCIVLTGDALTPTLLWIAVPLIGLAAGAELDLLAFLTARYFGIRNYGVLYGAQYGFFSVGSGFAPAIFGAVFDITGSYATILYISAGCFLVGAALILTLGKYPEFGQSAAHA
ncbi:MAG: MFS transporter, partial [Rhodospirillaceae bacterium]|nr:MFS transporter [Rhodospirillaceae bacterium]